MRHITTFEYIRLLITHNSKIAFLKFQMAFYRLFDFIEESWWVYVSPKKSKGDYHMSKLAQSMRQDGCEDLRRFSMINKLLQELQYDKEQQHRLNYLLYPAAYFRFMVDRELFDQMSIVCSIKNQKDLMDAGDLLGFNFRARYRTIYGIDALTEYENKGNES